MNQTIILLFAIVVGIVIYFYIKKEGFQSPPQACYIEQPSIIATPKTVVPQMPSQTVGATEQLKQAEQIYLNELAAPKINYELNSTWKGTSSSESYLDKYQLQTYNISSNSIGAIDNALKVQQKYLLESQHPFNFQIKDNYKDYGNAGAVDDLFIVGSDLFEHRNPLYFAYA